MKDAIIAWFTSGAAPGWIAAGITAIIGIVSHQRRHRPSFLLCRLDSVDHLGRSRELEYGAEFQFVVGGEKVQSLTQLRLTITNLGSTPLKEVVLECRPDEGTSILRTILLQAGIVASVTPVERGVDVHIPFLNSHEHGERVGLVLLCEGPGWVDFDGRGEGWSVKYVSGVSPRLGIGRRGGVEALLLWSIPLLAPLLDLFANYSDPRPPRE